MLSGLATSHDPDLLVGFSTSDDAGVYRLNDEMALVTTADFITPPVNDPYLFGQIAAANAISDVYAMGGRPVTCLSLAGFPSKKLDLQMLRQIVAGALDKITEAGAVLAGGHTVEDDEPKFGLAVNGIVHPERYWANSGAQPGDALILTKPVGSGVLFNANLKKWVSPEAMAECVQIIKTLNKRAAEIMGDFEIHAATDVTGFGLAGHGFEMAKNSHVALEIHVNRLPVMREALEMYERGMSTGMNGPNRELVKNHVLFGDSYPGSHLEIVFDPQTSGGLLAALPADQAENLINELMEGDGTGAQMIGAVEPLKGSNYLVFR